MKRDYNLLKDINDAFFIDKCSNRNKKAYKKEIIKKIFYNFTLLSYFKNNLFLYLNYDIAYFCKSYHNILFNTKLNNIYLFEFIKEKELYNDLIFLHSLDNKKFINIDEFNSLILLADNFYINLFFKEYKQQQNKKLRDNISEIMIIQEKRRLKESNSNSNNKKRNRNNNSSSKSDDSYQHNIHHNSFN